MTHRALVLTTPAAAAAPGHGAGLRVTTVVDLLASAGFRASTAVRVPRSGPGWCLGVGVSYATAHRVRGLRPRCGAVWLDATDSWLLTDLSGVRAGDAGYAARLVRDGARLLRLAPVDLVTYISADDRATDRGTVRGRQRLVVPARTAVPAAQERPDGARSRLVLAGDWDYPPNRDGLRWFTRSVLPGVAERRPAQDWEVVLFGSGSPQVAGPRTVHAGYAADPGALLRRGDVHVAPVRFGGGVKNKVVQPLLAGLPVVTTSAGAHGLREHPLLDVHDDPGAFAAAVALRLAEQDALRPALVEDLHDADDTDEVAAWLRRRAEGCGCDGSR